jgi:hypothetical protein
MKKLPLLFTLLSLFFSFSIYAQSPQKFNYQGVARNSSGTPLANTTIGLQLSITNGVITFYSETFTPTTSLLGLFNVEVGNGTVMSGVFNNIDWLSGPKSLKVEMDPTGGTSYIDMGSSPLISVPYALVANKVSSMNMNDLADVNTAGVITNQVLQWNGTEWVPANISGGSDNWGSQTAATSLPLTGNGTVVNPITMGSLGATPGQLLQWNGTTWVPANITGDGWGSTTAYTATTLTGNGTLSNPLGLAPQGASTGQVLQWNGTSWVPATITASGDNWGTQVVNTSSQLTGNGTILNPLGIASQGATPGQVLQWNGAAWIPAAVNGDNWGTQAVSTSLQFTGNGTIANPLTLSSQGAATGQVLQWNGTTWVPFTITGDNWGTQSLSASTQFSGNGTSGNPLFLAQQGAATGNVLKWTGSSWLPGTDNGFVLPYTDSVNITNPAIKLNNSGSGTVITAVNSSGGPGAIAIKAELNSPLSGASSVAVFAANNSTSNLGYGIYASHAGSGVGILATTFGGGTGVQGIGNVGVEGINNGPTGYAVHGVVTGVGYAGYFEGKSQMNFNSTGTSPCLLIRETEATDFARLRFDNTTPGKFWEIDAKNDPVTTNEMFHIWNGTTGALLTVRGDGNVGIGVPNPLQKLDVAGNIKFSGALMPNNVAGNSGQVLVSGGAGMAPTWTSPTNALYSNTVLADQTTNYTPTVVESTLPGLNAVAFSIYTPTKVAFNFSQGFIENGAAGGSNVTVVFKIIIKDNLNAIVNQTEIHTTLPNNSSENISFMHHAYLAGAGNYTVSVTGALLAGGDTDVTAYGISGNMSRGQLTMFAIPQ